MEREESINNLLRETAEGFMRADDARIEDVIKISRILLNHVPAIIETDRAMRYVVSTAYGVVRSMELFGKE